MKKIIVFLLFLVLPGIALASGERLEYQQQYVTLKGEAVNVRLPKGYRLELLTDALDGPRLISFTANGDLFMGSRSGQIYRLPSPYRQPEVLIELDDYPHSVAFRTGEILIARTGGISTARLISQGRRPWHRLRCACSPRCRPGAGTTAVPCASARTGASMSASVSAAIVVTST